MMDLDLARLAAQSFGTQQAPQVQQQQRPASRGDSLGSILGLFSSAAGLIGSLLSSGGESQQQQQQPNNSMQTIDASEKAAAASMMGSSSLIDQLLAGM